MDRKENKWHCKPCGHTNKKSSEVCMICGNPAKKNKIKIVERSGRKIISKAS